MAAITHRPASLFLVWMTAACSSGNLSSKWAPSAPDVLFADPPEGTVQEANLGDLQTPGAFIFDASLVHTIALELPPDSVAALAEEPYEDVLADADIDGLVLADVGVRLRGKIGSFRSLAGKPKLELDFNRFVDGRRVDGLESLSLNNSVVDCSYLKEVLGYTVFEALDTPAAQTSFARLTINGEDYGLYIVVETQDDRFLKARWENSDGNLYDGKYVWYGDDRYKLLDFAEGSDLDYQLEEGEDVEHADIRAISEALEASAGQPDFYATMGEVIDWDLAHRVWAGEQWVGQNDGYCINKNNYRVYFDPEDGLADFIPWDLDYSMLRDADWGRDWDSPAGNIARACFADTACRDAHRAVVADVLEAVDSLGLEEQMDDHLAQVGSLILSDPKRECDRRDIPAWHTYVRRWLLNRSAELEQRWDL